MNEGLETADTLHKRAIWRVLPVHPQPQWLESLSSYVLRLAEANGLHVTDELAALYGMKGRWKGVRLSLDYSSFSFGRLTSIAGCTLATLRGTTFYHLARHFACPVMHIPTLYRFFQGSIASSLRYCPGCLAEPPPPPWLSPPGRLWALRCLAPTPPACAADRALRDLPRGFANLFNLAHAHAGRDTCGQTDSRSRDAPDACRVGTGNHLGPFAWSWLRPLTARQAAQHG